MKRIKDTNDIRINRFADCYFIRVKDKKDIKVWGFDKFVIELKKTLDSKNLT